MPDIDPKSTYHGLPLTAEQDAEIRHYIKQRKQHGVQLDASELTAMIKDMLEPPSYPDDELDFAVEMRAEAERAAASIDEAMDPIEASEERKAAMESEAMKRPHR